MIQPSTSKPLHPHGQNIPLQGFKISIAHILPFANEVYDIICVGAAQSFSGPPGTDQREVQGGGMPERTAVAGGPQTAVRSSQFADRSSQFAVRSPQTAVSRRGDLWFTSSLSGLLGHLS